MPGTQLCHLCHRKRDFVVQVHCICSCIEEECVTQRPLVDSAGFSQHEMQIEVELAPFMGMQVLGC